MKRAHVGTEVCPGSLLNEGEALGQGRGLRGGHLTQTSDRPWMVERADKGDRGQCNPLTPDPGSDNFLASVNGSAYGRSSRPKHAHRTPQPYCDAIGIRRAGVPDRPSARGEAQADDRGRSETRSLFADPRNRLVRAPAAQPTRATRSGRLAIRPPHRASRPGRRPRAGGTGPHRSGTRPLRAPRRAARCGSSHRSPR